MADQFRPLTQRERDSRNHQLAKDHDLFPPEFKDWIIRLVKDRGPTLLASNLTGLGTAVNNYLPWTIGIDVFPTAVASTNWDTVTVNTNAIYNGYKASSGTVGDNISFDVSLSAGVWTFELMHVKGNDRGIYTVSLSAIGDLGTTIDGYNLGTTYNNRAQITGINVALTGKQRLTLTMKTKNGASASFVGAIQTISLRRTA